MDNLKYPKFQLNTKLIIIYECPDLLIEQLFRCAESPLETIVKRLSVFGVVNKCRIWLITFWSLMFSGRIITLLLKMGTWRFVFFFIKKL